MRIRYLLSSLALVGLTACTSVPPVGDIPASIANYTSASDHQRIADFFTEKAAKYDAEAAWHAKAANVYYASRPKGDPIAMRAHCLSLQEQFINAAKEARALADAHRQLASSVNR